jgi:hypothetical protein
MTTEQKSVNTESSDIKALEQSIAELKEKKDVTLKQHIDAAKAAQKLVTDMEAGMTEAESQILELGTNGLALGKQAALESKLLKRPVTYPKLAQIEKDVKANLDKLHQACADESKLCVTVQQTCLPLCEFALESERESLRKRCQKLTNNEDAEFEDLLGKMIGKFKEIDEDGDFMHKFKAVFKKSPYEEMFKVKKQTEQEKKTQAEAKMIADAKQHLKHIGYFCVDLIQSIEKVVTEVDEQLTYAIAYKSRLTLLPKYLAYAKQHDVKCNLDDITDLITECNKHHETALANAYVAKSMKEREEQDKRYGGTRYKSTLTWSIDSGSRGQKHCEYSDVVGFNIDSEKTVGIAYCWNTDYGSRY